MQKDESSKFSGVLTRIIEKSLFTERQVEVILNQKGVSGFKFPITKGAYYRQVGQSRNKLVGLYYSIILLRGLGVFLSDDVDVMLRLSEQVSVIKDSDVFPEREEEIISMMDRVIRQACNM